MKEPQQGNWREQGNWRALVLSITTSFLVSIAAGCAPEGDGELEVRDETAAEELREDTTEEEVRGELGEAYESIQSYSYEQKQELEAYAERTVREIEQELEVLRARMADGTGEARERWQETEVELEDELQDAEQWLDQVQAASAETWADTRAGLAEAMRRLEGGIEDARARLASEDRDEV